MTSTAVYDALALEIERADALSGHLEERLLALHEDAINDAPELYALSVIAHELCAKHQQMIGKARTLHKAKTVLLAVDPETAATYERKKHRPRALRVVAATPTVAKKDGA